MENEQAVIIKFDYGTTDLSHLFELEDRLEEIFSDSELGKYDGHEIAMDGSDGLLFFYGSSAEALLFAIRPILLQCGRITNVQAALYYGPPDSGAKEVMVSIK